MQTVIFVPGILDDIGFVQSMLVRLWCLRGVRGVTHVMPWAGPDNYPALEAKLLARIDALTTNGNRVVLIGASAGATAVINAYRARRKQVSAVLMMCPKINDSTNIGAKFLKKNPSFLTSIKQEEIAQAQLTAEDKARFVIFVSPRDGVVNPHDSLIAGVKTCQLAPLRHNAAILHGLSFGFGQLKRELLRIAEGS